MKKKQLKQYILYLALAALVAYLAVMPMLAAQEEEESGPKASILSANVTTGNIETALKGGGTLTAGKKMDVTVPSGVKIKSFLVSNGEAVREGDPVASVDKVSVMNAIVQVQDSLAYLQKQIGKAGNDTISGSIRSSAGGRVKQVFAQTGDSVSQVMLEHGALAVLSLDGRMAVELEQQTRLAAGDSVTVTLSGGKEITGRVESNLNGKLVVSVRDEGYGVDEKVTVTDGDGNLLGTGNLYVHNAWKATGFSGTVSTVYAKPETTVSEGSTLFTLKDTDYTGNLDHYAALHREYEQLLQELFRMYETEVLTAPCDGIVSGVDQDSPFLLSTGPDGTQGWYVDLLAAPPAEEQQWTVMLLSCGPVCGGTNTDGTCTAEPHIEGCSMYCTGDGACKDFAGKVHNEGCPALCIAAQNRNQCSASIHKPNCIEYCISSDGSTECMATGAHKRDCIKSCTSSDGTVDCPATEHHLPDCIESCVPSDGTKDCPATGAHKKNCIERCDKTANCTATDHHYPECLSLCDMTLDCPAQCHKGNCLLTTLKYTGTAALVRQVGSEALIVAADTATEYTLKNGGNGIELVNPASINTSLLLTEQVRPVSDLRKFKPGDVVIFWQAVSEGTVVRTGEKVFANIGGQQGGTMPDISGLLGGLKGFGSIGSFGGAMIGGGGSSASSEQELYPLDGEVLLTVTDHSNMEITITIDEQDITKVKPGQPARVQVVALKDQTFDAEVTDIGMVGSSNGGSSKFTVELTLPWQEDMLEGMNTTAVIPLYTKMEVLTLPVAALSEESGKTLVYRSLDPETGEPADPVEVSTGVSDGQTVEILSGLSSGDTVYYAYYDVLELDHTAKPQSGMFG